MLKADRTYTRRTVRLYRAVPPQQVAHILRAGLFPEDIALSPTLALAAVWLTDDARACARLAALGVPPAGCALLGFDPGASLRGADAPVRLAVRVPAGDRRLMPWARWAPAHLPAALSAAMAGCGAVRLTGWFLYRGRVPAAWISADAPALRRAAVCWDGEALAAVPAGARA